MQPEKQLVVAVIQGNEDATEICTTAHVGTLNFYHFLSPQRVPKSNTTTAAQENPRQRALLGAEVLASMCIDERCIQHLV